MAGLKKFRDRSFPSPRARERLERAVASRSLARKLLAKPRSGTNRHTTHEALQHAGSGRLRRRLLLRLCGYFCKMRGARVATAPLSLTETTWSFIGTICGMGALALVNVAFWGQDEQGLLLGSFGASAMLVFGAPHVPFAQPRNVIGGHMVSALAGVAVQQHLGGDPWLAASLAVALAVAAMHLTATLHPPGGATALIAVAGGPDLHHLGYIYVLYPVGVSMAVMVGVGLVINNLSANRRYPRYWW